MVDGLAWLRQNPARHMAQTQTRLLLRSSSRGLPGSRWVVKAIQGHSFMVNCELPAHKRRSDAAA